MEWHNYGDDAIDGFQSLSLLFKFQQLRVCLPIVDAITKPFLV